MTNERDELRGLLAQAYCTKENEQKVVDPVLIETMVDKLISEGWGMGKNFDDVYKKYHLWHKEAINMRMALQAIASGKIGRLACVDRARKALKGTDEK